MTDTAEKPATLLSTAEIQKVIPHRWPFLLVDRIVEEDAERGYIKAEKGVTASEWFFQGHFPDMPVMPGVLQVEALAQTLGVYVGQLEAYKGQVGLFAGIDGCRFGINVDGGSMVVVMAVGVLVTCYIVVLAWRLPMNLLYWDWIKHGYRPDHWTGYLDGFMGYFYVMLCWSGLYFGIKYYQQLQQQTEQTLKATAAAHQAQLKMLRYQLNPHFLFNTLNAISTLILEKQTENANRMVTRLSSFLRYSLDNDPMQKITLDQEIAALKLYLDIEKVRFEDHLGLELDIGEEASKALIPSLLLQPLVETKVTPAGSVSVTTTF